MAKESIGIISKFSPIDIRGRKLAREATLALDAAGDDLMTYLSTEYLPIPTDIVDRVLEDKSEEFKLTFGQKMGLLSIIAAGCALPTAFVEVVQHAQG